MDSMSDISAIYTDSSNDTVDNEIENVVKGIYNYFHGVLLHFVFRF